MFFGLHARPIIFNNDNNICIKKAGSSPIFFLFKRSMPIIRSIQSLGPKPLNMAEVIYRSYSINCPGRSFQIFRPGARASYSRLANY